MIHDNLFSALNVIPFVDLDLLLNGSSDLNREHNKRAILAVMKYIKIPASSHEYSPI